MVGTPLRSRLLAVLVLALFALGWLADRAHVAFERHAWCHEHQRVEHEQDDHAHVDDAAPAAHGGAQALAAHESGAACAHDAAPAPCPGRGPAFDPAESGGGEHAACCVLLARDGAPLALVPDRAPAPLPPCAESLARANAPAHAPVRPIPLVLLAPKQSPPTA